jgi:uncharacterized protein YqgC (DUF456 family)
MAERVFFFLCALIAISTAVGVVASRNPVRSALLLIANFLCLAMLYFTLAAPFIGIIQVIVYAGAIMVLFFVRDYVAQSWLARGTAAGTGAAPSPRMVACDRAFPDIGEPSVSHGGHSSPFPLPCGGRRG